MLWPKSRGHGRPASWRYQLRGGQSNDIHMDVRQSVPQGAGNGQLPNEAMDDRAWTAKDVAEFLQASESWVRHAAAAGRLPCTKIGGLLRFDPSEIRALVGRGEPPARPLPPRG